MLRVQSLTKVYTMGRSTLTVLHDVSLSIRDGEMLSIEGPSGAGKSTLLHVMGILDTPTEGRVLYGSADLVALSAREKAYWRNKLFGFVFQFYHLLPDFTALENVVLPSLAAARVGGWFMAKRESFDQGRELLRTVGLGDRMRHRPGQLSGGERQRVAIARALINSPRFLLCDEPTGNLDSHSGQNILDLLWRIREETDCTLVIVTHDPKVAARGERRVHMVDGRIT